jgi:plastocyanin
MRTFGWRAIVHATAAVSAALFLLAAAVLTDVEAALFGVGMFAGLVLLRWRRGLLGRLALLLLFADTALWMLPGAVGNLRSSEGFGATALPATLGIVSLTGLVGLAGTFVGRGNRLAKVIAVAAPVLLVAGLVVGAATSKPASVRRPGELALVAKDVKFSTKSLAARAGRVSVALSNRDLFWHTFTIRELDVSLRVPSIAQRAIRFDAAPGTHEFVCAIPGHEQAGMKGTLIVK